jgi:hypothetical protein
MKDIRISAVRTSLGDYASQVDEAPQSSAIAPELLCEIALHRVMGAQFVPPGDSTCARLVAGTPGLGLGVVAYEVGGYDSGARGYLLLRAQV